MHPRAHSKKTGWTATTGSNNHRINLTNHIHTFGYVDAVHLSVFHRVIQAQTRVLPSSPCILESHCAPEHMSTDLPVVPHTITLAQHCCISIPENIFLLLSSLTGIGCTWVPILPVHYLHVAEVVSTLKVLPNDHHVEAIGAAIYVHLCCFINFLHPLAGHPRPALCTVKVHVRLAYTFCPSRRCVILIKYTFRCPIYGSGNNRIFGRLHATSSITIFKNSILYIEV